MGDKKNIYIPDLKKSLQIAKKDENIKALYIQVQNLQASYAQLDDISKALFLISKHQESLFIFGSVYGDTKSYFLSVVADKLSYTAPTSTLNIPGVVINMVYLREAFAKIGLQFEVSGAGKFKSAFEPFIKDNPSLETIEAYSGIKNTINNLILKKIVENRKEINFEIAKNIMQKSLSMQKIVKRKAC